MSLYFFFLDRSVLFPPTNMHVRHVISSLEMNAAEYCDMVKSTATWMVQQFAGAVLVKWGVSLQSSYMRWTFGVCSPDRILWSLSYHMILFCLMHRTERAACPTPILMPEVDAASCSNP